MSSAAGPSIATNGLVLDFDAANLKSFGPPAVEVLVVAGGGGGGLGSNVGAGGGAGGLIYNSAFLVTAGTAVTVTVGAGGAKGVSGSNSVFSSLTAIGGGYGGAESPVLSGAAGGSGGGQCYNGGTIGAGTAGQGNNGGAAGVAGTGYPGGGGGGASAVGGAGVNSVRAGAGGIGRLFDISGALTYYAGGGGGGAWVGVSTYAPGGLGGGGAGSFNGQTTFISPDGTPNTGGGGGGGFTTTNANTAGGSGAGGSGVVIIRYPGLQKATGGTITTAGGYTVHTFTTGGTFTPGTNWADVSGNTNIGTLTNGPTYSATNGGSLVFDGSNDFIVLPTFTNKPTTNMTVSAWIYPTRTPSTGTIRGGAISSSNSMYLGLIDSIDGGIGHALHFASQTSVSRVTSQTGSIPMNQWSYIVGTYDGTTMRAYLNGTEVYSAAQTGTIPDATYYVGTYNGYTDAVHNFLGNIATAQIHNRALSVAEIKQNFNAQIGRYRVGLGTHQSVPAISAAAIKADNPSVQSGVYWLYSTGINSGAPFQCYCDFTMDGGIGYAIYFQQYFDSADDGGTAGYEYGPTFASMASTAITGTAGYGNEFKVYPNLMPIQYNNGAGASRMIVYNKTNTGTSAGGVQGATNYKWTRVSGITATNMRDIWTATPSYSQYIVSFVSAGNSGRTAGSGTGYILGAHGPTYGPHQWVANTPGNVNDYLIFEYKPFANVNDPNHYWMVDTGVSGSAYFRANSEYGASGVFQTRYGGIAIY